MKSNNEFVFPDPELSITNFLYEYSEISDQFRLCSFMFLSSFVASKQFFFQL